MSEFELAMFVDGKCRVQAGLYEHGEMFVKTAHDYECEEDLRHAWKKFFDVSVGDEPGSVEDGRVELRWYRTRHPAVSS